MGWICDGERRIGMIRLCEWNLSAGITDKFLFEVADAFSQAAQDFAFAVLSFWPIASLTRHGNLLEVCYVWMQPEYAKGSVWAEALEKLISRRYLNRYSVMLLNCWPMSYKAVSINVEGWRGRERWNKRRTALARLAHQKLGVRPLPPIGDDQDRWWLWCPLKAGVPRPRKRKLTWL